MDKKLKSKWLKALRSGRYKQTKGFLRRGDHYCCIGVLCQIQRANFEKLNMKELKIGKYADGLTEKNLSHLAQMNDGTLAAGEPRCSFKQIADYIEKTY